MKRLFNGASTHALFAQVGVALALISAVNALVFTNSWFNVSDAETQRFPAPSGSTVGVVWVVLFGCIAVARWRLSTHARPDATKARRVLVVIGGLILAYPLLTLGFHSNAAGLSLNVVIIALALWTAYITSPWDTRPALWLSPLIAWVTYASLLIADEARWF